MCQQEKCAQHNFIAWYPHSDVYNIDRNTKYSRDMYIKFDAYSVQD